MGVLELLLCSYLHFAINISKLQYFRVRTYRGLNFTSLIPWNIPTGTYSLNNCSKKFKLPAQITVCILIITWQAAHYADENHEGKNHCLDNNSRQQLGTS